MPRVVFVSADGETRDIVAATGRSLMETAVENGVPGIDADCGGACACATCHVIVAPDWIDRLPEPADDERAMLEFAVDPGPRSRLACQIRLTDALDGLEVRTPATQR